MLTLLLLVTAVILYLGYKYYGRFLEKRCQTDPARKTPAAEVNDGIDYVPTRPSILFGHHFSSIAGAGPIVGPIIAGLAFGWGPTWLWIIIGAVLIGGVHDFGSTLMSLRNKGQSITSTCRHLVGETTGKLFLLFVLFALIYVIIVFLDLTAAGFTARPAVATSSGWFILTALGFGYALRSNKIALKLSIPLFVVLTYFGLAVGHWLPLEGVSKNTWLAVVLLYCYMAAILPVNFLMQPRDFLSATFLYAIMVLGVLGLLLSGKPSELAFFKGFHAENLGYLMPFLFITVACGACSGFHCMVASGTTSKQISNEGDVKKVSYGSMLVEGLLATFALCCVAVIGSAEGTPVATFANGSAVFFGSLGIPLEIGATFAMLAVSTFLLTTLDTCTRLTRFLVEELFAWRNAQSRYLGTLLVLTLPALAAFQTYTSPDGTVMPVWRAIWPLFGATNQLLAALALITFVVFLKSRNIKYGFAFIPAVIMIIMPMSALAAMTVSSSMDMLLRIIAAVMFILGLYVVIMSVLFLFSADEQEPAGAQTEQSSDAS